MKLKPKIKARRSLHADNVAENSFSSQSQDESPIYKKKTQKRQFLNVSPKKVVSDEDNCSFFEEKRSLVDCSVNCTSDTKASGSNKVVKLAIDAGLIGQKVIRRKEDCPLLSSDVSWSKKRTKPKFVCKDTLIAKDKLETLCGFTSSSTDNQCNADSDTGLDSPLKTPSLLESSTCKVHTNDCKSQKIVSAVEPLSKDGDVIVMPDDNTTQCFSDVDIMRYVESMLSVFFSAFFVKFVACDCVMFR